MQWENWKLNCEEAWHYSRPTPSLKACPSPQTNLPLTVWSLTGAGAYWLRKGSRACDSNSCGPLIMDRISQGQDFSLLGLFVPSPLATTIPRRMLKHSRWEPCSSSSLAKPYFASRNSKRLAFCWDFLLPEVRPCLSGHECAEAQASCMLALSPEATMLASC